MTSPATSSKWRGSTSPEPQLSSLPHLPPSITVGHPTNMWRGGVVAPPPDPNPPPSPHTGGQPTSLGMGDENWRTVCVCVGGGGGVRGHARPLQITVYAETQRRGVPYVLVCFAPSPTALSFIPRILLRRLKNEKGTERKSKKAHKHVWRILLQRQMSKISPYLG
jgi:hypothetical protein